MSKFIANGSVFQADPKSPVATQLAVAREAVDVGGDALGGGFAAALEGFIAAAGVVVDVGGVEAIEEACDAGRIDVGGVADRLDPIEPLLEQDDVRLDEQLQAFSSPKPSEIYRLPRCLNWTTAGMRPERQCKNGVDGGANRLPPWPDPLS